MDAMDTKRMKCPRCPIKHYFGRLFLANERVTPCTNCGATLIPIERHA